MRIFVLIAGLFILIAIEVLRVYFIMPFPGSQSAQTIDIAYFIHNTIIWFRLVGIVLIAYPVWYVLSKGSKLSKGVLIVVLILYAVIFYLFNFRFLADKMFLLPQTIAFENPERNKIPLTQLVIGVTLGGVSKAYPIEIIGYHHQVRDTLNGQPIMITYCTVCRTGRVFSPKVGDKLENFRLVGMDHFNAMFEDSTTKSWWRQVNGEAVVGPLKGKMLTEIPSEQMRLSAWMDQHPNTLIMQEDNAFKEKYDKMKDYDEGKSNSNLTRHDSLSWQSKSWIVGVQSGMKAKAYDWNDLQRRHVINDFLDGQPLMVVLQPDSVSFHAFSRVVGQDTLVFSYNEVIGNITDTKTNSLWNWNGECVTGDFKGKQLSTIQSYQEFWHSWKTFRPQTEQYLPSDQ